MKIVINTCHGGFGLSHEAIMAYAKRKGITLYGFVLKCNPTSGAFEYIPYSGENDPLCILYSTNNNLKLEDSHSFSCRDIPRNDPDLVAVVEELGDATANSYASLKVVEIPDDIQWEIKEYDGVEWIAEKHRTWN